MRYLILFTALGISFIAAYYSIVGLAAIFAASVIPVIVMGSALVGYSSNFIKRLFKLCYISFNVHYFDGYFRLSLKGSH